MARTQKGTQLGRILGAASALSLLLLGGCLFPPVEAPPPDEDGDPVGPSPGPDGIPPETRLVSRSDSFQGAGDIGQAVSAGGTATTTERHTHPLPPRVTGLTLRFDWDPQAGEDLDLALAVQQDGQTVWSHDADGGRTGTPDDPIVLAFDDLGDDAYTAAESLLVLDVTAEVSYSTLYEYAGTYTYEQAEARGTGP